MNAIFNCKIISSLTAMILLIVDNNQYHMLLFRGAYLFPRAALDDTRTHSLGCAGLFKSPNGKQVQSSVITSDQSPQTPRVTDSSPECSRAGAAGPECCIPVRSTRELPSHHHWAAGGCVFRPCCVSPRFCSLQKRSSNCAC